VTRALACSLLGYTTLALAQPLLGPPREVDAPSFAPTINDQQTPALAFGGANYLAVWREGDKNIGQIWTIHSVRLGLDGLPLEAPSRVVADTGQVLANPTVGFDGQSYLVVWQAPASGGAHVVGAYVSPSTGVAGAPFPIAAAANTAQTKPTISGGSGLSLVAFQSFSSTFSEPTIRAVLLGQGMTIKPSFPVSANPVGMPATTPVASFNPATSSFLVGWQEDQAPSGRVVGTRVSTTGVAEAPFFISAAGIDARDPTLAAGPAGWVAAWATGAGGLQARAVPTSGAPASAEFVVAAVPVDGTWLLNPQLLGAGGTFFGAWEKFDPVAGLSVVHGGRFTAAGVRQDGNGVRISTLPPSFTPLLPADVHSHRQAAAGDGARGLVVIGRSTANLTGDDVYAQVLDPTASPLDAQPPRLVTRERNVQITRAVATNGDVFLAVWEDNRNAQDTGLDIYGLRLDREGSALDTQPFVISAAPDDQFNAQLAARPGGDFLVVWADARNLSGGTGVDLYGATVSAAGAVTPLAFPVNDGDAAQIAPAVAGGSGGWLVAWEDWATAVGVPGSAAVWSAFVPAGGLTEVPTAHQLTLVSSQKLSACAASATWDGLRFFVAYEQPCSQIANAGVGQKHSDVLGRWHDPAGLIVGAPVGLGTGAGFETAPSVTAGGGRVYAAWRDQTAQEGIAAAALSSGAAAPIAPPVAVVTGAAEAPAIAWVPGALLLTFVEPTPGGVRALRLRDDATLARLDAQPFTLSTGEPFRVTDLGAATAQGHGVSGDPRFTPPAQVAATDGGEALAAHTIVDSLDGKGVPRAKLRKLGVLPSGSACTRPGGCAGGHCTGGHCCDQPCDGICQACGAAGCVETPATDARCGGAPERCGALSSACRVYHDPAGSLAGACSEFGQCAQPGDAIGCSFTDAPDGTACPCESASATCAAGLCQCPDRLPPYLPRPTPGCSASGETSPPLAPLALLALLALLTGGWRSRGSAAGRRSRARCASCDRASWW
jgi:hypothetical protein